VCVRYSGKKENQENKKKERLSPSLFYIRTALSSNVDRAIFKNNIRILLLPSPPPFLFIQLGLGTHLGQFVDVLPDTVADGEFLFEVAVGTLHAFDEVVAEVLAAVHFGGLGRMMSDGRERSRSGLFPSGRVPTRVTRCLLPARPPSPCRSRSSR
jgi:hypothetical protein